MHMSAPLPKGRRLGLDENTPSDVLGLTVHASAPPTIEPSALAADPQPDDVPEEEEAPLSAGASAADRLAAWIMRYLAEQQPEHDESVSSIHAACIRFRKQSSGLMLHGVRVRPADLLKRITITSEDALTDVWELLNEFDAERKRVAAKPYTWSKLTHAYG